MTSALLTARGRLDVRQRDASRASLVASSDPTGNDNRSNRTTQQSVRDTDSQRRRQHNYSDSDSDDDEDDDIDDSDDISSPHGDTRDPSDSVVCGRTCTAATDDRYTKLVKGRGQATNDRQEDSRQCDQTSDREHSTDGSLSSRSKYAAKGNHVCQDRNEKDSGWGKPHPTDRERKQDGGRLCEYCGQQTCDFYCDAAQKAADEYRDEREHHVIVSRCNQTTSCDDDEDVDRRRTSRRSDQTRPFDRKQRKPERDLKCSGCGRKTCECDDSDARRRRDPPTDSDYDVLRGLRRRDDESLDSYLIRSILLLGSIASQSNDADNECNSSAGTRPRKSYNIDQVEFIKRSHSPARAAYEVDPYRLNSRRQHEIGLPLTQWSRTSSPALTRFSPIAGSRYSGNRQTYSRGGGSTCDRSSVPYSNSFSTIQMTDARTEGGRWPLRGGWRTGSNTYWYRSNRGDRDRFATRSSRYSEHGNVNMHSNQTLDAETSETGGAAVTAAGMDAVEEVNTNNSRLERDNDDKTTTTTDSSDFIATDRTVTVISDITRHVQPSTGTGVFLDNNNSNNNDTGNYDNDVGVILGTEHTQNWTKPAQSAVGVDGKTNSGRVDERSDGHTVPAADGNNYDYQSATRIDPPECTLVNEQGDVNYNADARRRGTASRRGRRAERRRSDGVRRSTAALRATSCSAMEADVLLRRLESDRLRPHAELLAGVLDEYRHVLGLDESDNSRPLEAAWRLAGLPVGRWLVSEVLKQAEKCLSDLRDVKPSTLCRRRGVSELGVALLDGVDDQITSRLVGSVSAEVEHVVLQQAVQSVVQSLVNMAASLHRQSVICPIHHSDADI